MNKFSIKSNPIRWMTETSLLLALYVIFYIMAYFWSRAFWPQGGTVGIHFVVILLCIYRLDWMSTTIVAFAGLLISNSMVMIIVNPWQFLLDYCYSLVAIPLAALITFWIKNKYINIVLFGIIVLFVHFVAAVLSGSLFFSQYAPVGQTAVIYSLIYNSTYLIPSYIVSTIIFLSIMPLLKNLKITNNIY